MTEQLLLDPTTPLPIVTDPGATAPNTILPPPPIEGWHGIPDGADPVVVVSDSNYILGQVTHERMGNLKTELEHRLSQQLQAQEQERSFYGNTEHGHRLNHQLQASQEGRSVRGFAVAENTVMGSKKSSNEISATIKEDLINSFIQAGRTEDNPRVVAHELRQEIAEAMDMPNDELTQGAKSEAIELAHEAARKEDVMRQAHRAVQQAYDEIHEEALDEDEERTYQQERMKFLKIDNPYDVPKPGKLTGLRVSAAKKMDRAKLHLKKSKNLTAEDRMRKLKIDNPYDVPVPGKTDIAKALVKEAVDKEASRAANRVKDIALVGRHLGSKALKRVQTKIEERNSKKPMPPLY